MYYTKATGYTKLVAFYLAHTTFGLIAPLHFIVQNRLCLTIFIGPVPIHAGKQY